jgi:hypothetical protein
MIKHKSECFCLSRVVNITLYECRIEDKTFFYKKFLSLVGNMWCGIIAFQFLLYSTFLNMYTYAVLHIPYKKDEYTF